MDRAVLDGMSGDDVAEVIGQIHALEVATRAAMLEFVAAFDRSEAWRDDGATSATAWLAYRLGLSHRTAAEWVRLAGALSELPRIAEAFASGLLSWDQLRAVVSMATPDTDAEWAERAPTLSAAALEALARQARMVSREADAQSPSACAGGGTTITGGCACQVDWPTPMEPWSSPPSTAWPSRRRPTRSPGSTSCTRCGPPMPL